MGTYILDVAISVDLLVGPLSGNYDIGGGPVCNNADASLLIGINSDDPGAPPPLGRVIMTAFCDSITPTTDIMAIRFGHDLSSNLISLDGNPYQSFNNLPAGFRLLTEQVQVTLRGSLNGSFTLEFDTFTVSGNLGTNTSGVNVVKAFNHPAPVNVLDMFTSGFGVRWSGVGVHLVTDFIYEGKFVGNYDIFSSSITITDPIVDGNDITIDADPDLTEITEIKIKKPDNTIIQTIPSTDFIQWTTIRIRFTFHFPGYAGPIVLEGTTFSGSVLLGQIDVIIADGSGIYRIVADKREDTIYVASSVDPTTTDVAFPTPFAKTGFIGS